MSDTSEKSDSVEPQTTTVFDDGQWYKLGHLKDISGVDGLLNNEIFKVVFEKSDTDILIVNTIKGEQKRIQRSAFMAMQEPHLFALAPINVGDAFRLPGKKELEELGMNLPTFLDGRINTGAIMRVRAIHNGGSIFEVEFKNGLSFNVLPEILSKFKRKGKPKKEKSQTEK